jgi:pyruvate formate lyase activating enzyme
MMFTGQEWSLDALVKEVLKDKEYYHVFGGGVTVSGGEPLNQYRFVSQFFQKLHEESVHTALDTCGLAPANSLASVLPHTDHVLFDIKIIDPEMHRQYTGQSNENILQNLLDIASTIRQENDRPGPGENDAKQLWIRTPLIPDATATPKNIRDIGRFIQEQLLDVVARWEMCAFNNACVQKYDKLGMPWSYADYPLMEQTFVDSLESVALSTGIPREKLVVSGLIARGSVGASKLCFDK